jgi:hypothetical protein
VLSVKLGRALWLGQAMGFAGAIGVILSQAIQDAFATMPLLSAIWFEGMLSVFYIWSVPILSVFILTPYLLVRPNILLSFVFDALLVVACTYLGAARLEIGLRAIPGTSPSAVHLFYYGLKGTWMALLPIVFWASDSYRRSKYADQHA